MHDDQASLLEQLRTARFDADAQREMKVKAREQRDRVTSLLTQTFNLLVAIREAYKQDKLTTWDDRDFDRHVDRIIDAYYKRPTEKVDDE